MDTQHTLRIGDQFQTRWDSFFNRFEVSLGRRADQHTIEQTSHCAVLNFISIRQVKRLIKSKPTRGGARMCSRRAFGFGNASAFDLLALTPSSLAKADVLVN
jgi:hypothetical protein